MKDETGERHPKYPIMTIISAKGTLLMSAQVDPDCSLEAGFRNHIHSKNAIRVVHIP